MAPPPDGGLRKLGSRCPVLGNTDVFISMAGLHGGLISPSNRWENQLTETKEVAL